MPDELAVNLSDPALGCVINEVADEIGRPSQHGLGAERPVSLVEAAIAQDAYVTKRAVGLDQVVHVADVIADDVDGHRHAITDYPAGSVRFRIAIGGVVDAVVEVRDVVVFDHMPGAIDLDCGIGSQRHREVRKRLPGSPDPAHEVIGDLPPYEHIVGDVEVLRPRPVRGDADTHILEP